MGIEKDTLTEKNSAAPAVTTENSEVLEEKETVIPDVVLTETPVNTTPDNEALEQEEATSTDVKETVMPVVTTPDIEVLKQTETIIIFKVTRPLMTHEYDELSMRVRAENQASGLKVVLAPAIVDSVEISG